MTGYEASDHHYPACNWYCDVHRRECSPSWTPITVDELLTMAARDESLPDGAFAVLAQALEGREIT